MKLTPWEPDLRTVVSRIDEGDIDLQPDFQRQEVWSIGKKKRLIDTILRGWSIPPVFLVVTNDGRMDVLDGQQRLASIRDFFHGDFSIDGGITPEDDKILSLHGRTYKRLDAPDRRALDQYAIRCFRITDYLPDEPSELFYRLNQPSMLTAGEQRNAFYGPAREQLKKLVNVFEGQENNKTTIGFSNSRLSYDDIIARLLVFNELGSISVKGTENLVSQRFKLKEEFHQDIVDDCRSAIDLFSEEREKIGAVRLNKASTLSWLLFFSRANKSNYERGYMGYFQDISSLHSGKDYFTQAQSVFQDRSSLRVTDVSSVVYRDFVLWFVYNFSGSERAPSNLSEMIDLVKDVLDGDGESPSRKG